MNREEAIHYLESSGFSEEQINTIEQAFKKEPCEMTAEEYRRRMIQAFHNADTGELIAVCVFPTEKEFEFLEWLLKNHYKKEPCNDVISRRAAIDAIEKTKAAMATDGEIYVAKINAEMNIQQLPSVSAEKPNRCKDCSYFQSREKSVYANTNGVKVTNGSHTCFYWDGSGVPEDGFCHNFEKMDAKEARRLIGGE